jgi:hypothetical protein
MSVATTAAVTLPPSSGGQDAAATPAPQFRAAVVTPLAHSNGAVRVGSAVPVASFRLGITDAPRTIPYQSLCIGNRLG